MRDREPSPLCRFAPVVALIEGLRPRATHIPTALIEGLRSRAALVTTPQCCVYIPAPSFRASLNGSGCRVVAPGRVGWARVGGVSVFRFLGSGFLSWALAFWLFGFLASVFAFSVPFPVWLASGLPLRRPVLGVVGTSAARPRIHAPTLRVKLNGREPVYYRAKASQDDQ